MCIVPMLLTVLRLALLERSRVKLSSCCSVRACHSMTGIVGDETRNTGNSGVAPSSFSVFRFWPPKPQNTASDQEGGVLDGSIPFCRQLAILFLGCRATACSQPTALLKLGLKRHDKGIASSPYCVDTRWGMHSLCIDINSRSIHV